MTKQRKQSDPQGTTSEPDTTQQQPPVGDAKSGEPDVQGAVADSEGGEPDPVLTSGVQGFDPSKGGEPEQPAGAGCPDCGGLVEQPNPEADAEFMALQQATESVVADGIDINTLAGRVEIEKRARASLGLPEMQPDLKWRDVIDTLPGHGISDEERATLDGVITVRLFYSPKGVRVIVSDSSGLTSVPVGSPAHVFAWALRAAGPLMFQVAQQILDSAAPPTAGVGSQPTARQSELVGPDGRPLN